MSAEPIAIEPHLPATRTSAAPALPRVNSIAELGVALSRRLAQCRRMGEQLTLLWIELDPLPQASDPNETSPQSRAGVMRMAGLRMRNRVRGTDDVVQVGEQGFAVLLPGAGRPESALVTLRLKQALTGTYVTKGERAYLAVALGEAVFPDSGRTGVELAESAQRSAALRQGG